MIVPDGLHNSIPVSGMFQPAFFSPYHQRPFGDQSTFQQSRRYETLTGVKFSVDFISVSSKQGSMLDSPAYIVERHKSRDAIDESAANWKRYILDLSAPTDVDALSETIDSIYDAIDRYGSGAVNLATLPADAVNGEHLAAILRSTYPFRNQIIGWHHARDIAIKALQGASIDINDALAGLL